MASKKVLTPANLSSDFVLNASKKLVEVNWGNAQAGTVKKFQIVRESSISVGTGESEQRTVLLTRNGLGIIHLDFTFIGSPTGQGDLVGRIPPEAPVPDNLIETQMFDGTSVWVVGGSRDIYANVNRGVRYIFDLVGFVHYE